MPKSRARETGIEVRHTMCDICTPGPQCGVDAYIKDGVVIKVEGTAGFPTNNGALCTKGSGQPSVHLPEGPYPHAYAPDWTPWIGQVRIHFLGRGGRRRRYGAQWGQGPPRSGGRGLHDGLPQVVSPLPAPTGLLVRQSQLSHGVQHLPSFGGHELAADLRQRDAP